MILQTFEQYKNIKQQALANIFKDRHDPNLKWIQEAQVTKHHSFSNYFTDYERAYKYIKDRLKELESK